MRKRSCAVVEAQSASEMAACAGRDEPQSRLSSGRERTRGEIGREGGGREQHRVWRAAGWSYASPALLKLSIDSRAQLSAFRACSVLTSHHALECRHIGYRKRLPRPISTSDNFAARRERYKLAASRIRCAKTQVLYAAALQISRQSMAVKAHMY
ncbi:hypothetical protein PYCCODRAFT_933344 [Trametes coccinea BRFM310]|uniref:Uncharacterized protein n=1 Tax=Trametes coccinea (strain BRFM310) TaxID=1353009 RepID=A0A1Y2IZH1_TRAC3|nr:hypothetical protein PYCCODRAFT_933344 [Trametes coccinea BRFM310]